MIFLEKTVLLTKFVASKIVLFDRLSSYFKFSFQERMPLIALDPFDSLLALARHTPIPTLNSYIIISLLLTAGSAFYAKLTFTKDEVCVS